MEEKIETSVLEEVAMKIILHAGDARLKSESALRKVRNFKFEDAKIELTEAKECIRLAHQSQTEIIQKEARGEHYESSLLFNHAQDTLMTIMSEINITNEMIDLFEIMYRMHKQDEEE